MTTYVVEPIAAGDVPGTTVLLLERDTSTTVTTEPGAPAVLVLVDGDRKHTLVQPTAGDVTVVSVGEQDTTQAVVQTVTPTFAVITPVIGPKGDPTPLTALAYAHIQDVPTTEWLITHTLPYSPSVTVIDSAGRVVEGDVTYPSGSTITVTFSAPFAGVAYLS